MTDDEVNAMVYGAFEVMWELAGGQDRDRASVIQGAAWLDAALERLLKRVMHHHPGGSDSLFSPDRPLGSFSAKVALAYRLGLIDRDFEHALQMIKKMRNDFAHSLDRATLSDSPYRERVDELVRVVRRGAMWNRWGEYELSPPVEPGPLSDFCIAFSVMLVILELVERLNGPVEFKYICGFHYKLHLEPR